MSDEYTKVQLRGLMKQAQSAELSPTETMDFFAVKVFELDADEWGLLRGVSEQTVKHHLHRADEKIGQWAADNGGGPDE